MKDFKNKVIDTTTKRQSNAEQSTFVLNVSVHQDKNMEGTLQKLMEKYPNLISPIRTRTQKSLKQSSHIKIFLKRQLSLKFDIAKRKYKVSTGQYNLSLQVRMESSIIYGTYICYGGR